MGEEIGLVYGEYDERVPANVIVPKLCPSRSNISQQFQTKPKIRWKIEIESTACNYSIFGFSKSWTENPPVAPQAHWILSLGTMNYK